MTVERNPVDLSKVGLPWLRRKLVGLFDSAAETSTPDHAVCAKYADLLFKIMSSSPPDEDSGAGEIKELETIRRSVLGLDEGE